MMPAGSNLLCRLPHGADPQFTCVHLKLTPPFCVDVINEWSVIRTVYRIRLNAEEIIPDATAAPINSKAWTKLF